MCLNILGKIPQLHYSLYHWRSPSQKTCRVWKTASLSAGHLWCVPLGLFCSHSAQQHLCLPAGTKRVPVPPLRMWWLGPGISAWGVLWWAEIHWERAGSMWGPRHAVLVIEGSGKDAGLSGDALPAPSLSLSLPAAFFFPSYLLFRLHGFELLKGWRWEISIWDGEVASPPAVQALCALAIFQSHGNHQNWFLPGDN